MRLRPRAFLVGAVLLLSAACVNAGTPLSVPHYAVGYTPGEELYAGPDVPVVVLGNPFPMPQAELVPSVIAAMQGWTFRPDHFVPAADPNAVYRVIMMLNPPNTIIGETMCERPMRIPAQFGVPPAPRVRVAASLCRGDGNLAFVFGSIETAGGPAGPPFRQGIGQFTEELFPPQNPEARPAGCQAMRC
jgi:hypothetical protein